MTLPVSGAISFNAINVELGVAGTTTANINQASYRNLAGVPSGTISLSNFYGKSSTFNLTKTISSSTQNYNLLADMQANGFTNGSAFTVNLIIGSGVYIWTDTTATAAFDTGAISGPGTITITNNGFIMGKGGPGGNANPLSGTAGGPAINLQRSVTINNTNGSAYIGGGGGGGGGAAQGSGGQSAGGGAGGGPGGANNNPGGAGGSIGASGSNGNTSGGGGGRIFPGSGGAAVSASATASIPGNGGGAGGGGSLIQSFFKTFNAAAGGGGGGWGASGGSGQSRTGGPSAMTLTSGAGGSSNGAGGSTSFSSGSNPIINAGSAGGKAVNLNGNSVTWTSGDTTRVYGAVS